MLLSHRTDKLLLGFTCRLAETHLEDTQLRTLEPESSLLYAVIPTRLKHGAEWGCRSFPRSSEHNRSALGCTGDSGTAPGRYSSAVQEPELELRAISLFSILRPNPSKRTGLTPHISISSGKNEDGELPFSDTTRGNPLCQTHPCGSSLTATSAENSPTAARCCPNAPTAEPGNSRRPSLPPCPAPAARPQAPPEPHFRSNAARAGGGPSPHAAYREHGRPSPRPPGRRRYRRRHGSASAAASRRALLGRPTPSLRRPPLRRPWPRAAPARLPGALRRARGRAGAQRRRRRHLRGDGSRSGSSGLPL